MRILTDLKRYLYKNYPFRNQSILKMSLLKKLSKFGGREALFDTKRSLSYAQLYRASWALASQMTVRFRQAKKWPVEKPRIVYLTNRDVLHPMA